MIKPITNWVKNPEIPDARIPVSKIPMIRAPIKTPKIDPAPP